MLFEQTATVLTSNKKLSKRRRTMTITIKAGESVESSMKYLQAFFDERKEEYSVLKTT